ncbi:MAG: hypothetical protein E7329_04700 [Clostridiales bacterium]|nr:hypothetical protein [Clostridiales bacterium]
MYERTGKLIREKFREYLLPTVMTSMAVSMASVVDGAIVGNLLGDVALATVGLAGPIIFCINLIYMLFGIGGLTCASIARGKREMHQANLIFTLTIGMGVGVMLVFSLAMQFIMPSLSLSLAGNDALLASMLESYLRPLVFTGPALMFSSGMALFIRTDGQPKSSALVVIIANAVNLVFDYVLIRFFHVGIWGAGFSTTLGYVAGAAIVLPYLFSQKRNFRFVRPGRESLRTLGNILGTGLPKALIQVANILRSLALNSIIISFLGSIGMSVMTVCINVQMISNIFVGGVSDALLPIVGTLFGERDSYGIRQTMKSALTVLAASCAALLALLLLAPQLMGMAFGMNSAQGMAALKPALRLFALYLPFDAAIQLLQNFYTTTGRKRMASAMVIMNGLIFVLPFAFLLAHAAPDFFWLCYACSGAATLLVTAAVCKRIQKKERLGSVLLLRETNDRDIRYDVTIKATAQQATGLSAHLIAWCTKQGLDARMANRVGVAMEEMAVSTAHYAHGGSDKGVIDVAIRLTDETLEIRLRDNGQAFNPVEYIADENDGCITDGVRLIRQLAKSIDYARQLGFNTTVITFSRMPKKP